MGIEGVFIARTIQTHLSSGFWNKAFFKLEHCKLGSIPEFVAELSVSFNAQYLEVDISSTRRIRAQSESQRISATLWDTLREILLLPLLRFGNLALVEITIEKLEVKIFQADTLNDIDGINDVPQRFTHLPPMCVADHGVTVDFWEGNLVGQVNAQHYHAGDPKEQDIPARLQNRGWIEILEILRLDPHQMLT
jgi:hypothetical protein